jgi:flagellar hook-length control protein FliK
MSEQLLNRLFGKVTSKESPYTMASNKAENPLKANLEEENFSEKLAYSVKNMSASNKQVPTSVAAKSTLSNQEEDINLIIEMISKGILTDIEGLREQLNHESNNNTNKETFINNIINYIPDSRTTPVPAQFQTLLYSEGALSPARTMKLNGEEASSLMQSVKNGEEISSLAKAVQNSGEAPSLSNPVESAREVSSLIKAASSKGNGMPSSAQSINNSEAISSVSKSAGGGEEVSFQAEAVNSQDLISNFGNRSSGQLTAQHANRTVPEESNPNLSLRQDSVQAEVEDSELHHALNISKSQDVTTSLNENNIPGNIRSDESTNQVTVSQDNSFLNNQGSDTAKEPSVNLTNIKQDIEPKIDFANISKQINVTQPFESLGVDLVDNFIQRARLFMQGDKSVIRLQLNPPELGSLKLEFTVEDDVLEAKILVERSAVKEIIEKDIPRLRELISNTEIDVGKLDVFLQEKEDEGFGLMDKGLQSDSESNQTQEFTNQEVEGFYDEADKELEPNAASSNRINYLV